MITIKRLKIYWKIWATIASYAFQETFLNRWTNLLFLFGKMVRFGMLLVFLFLLHQNITGIAGYTMDQVIVFYLTYQFLDTFAQIIYRGVYAFSNSVRTGELDFYLSKPINPLFRILTGKPDILDVIFFFPTTIISLWIISHLQLHITPASVASYFALLINSFFIVTAFHILVVCLGVVTTEVDNAIMLYRDFTNLSRFPVNMYGEPFRTILFFVIPVGLMNTVPAQILMNRPPSISLFVTAIIGMSFFFISLKTWGWSVRHYSSAGG